MGIKIEPGKKYKNRNGKIIEILNEIKSSVNYRDGIKSYLGNDNFSYDELDGIWSRHNLHEDHEFDLIEEVKDETMNWNPETLYTLKEIMEITKGVFPFEVMNTVSVWGFAGNRYANPNEIVKILKRDDFYICSENFKVGIDSANGNHKVWKLISIGGPVQELTEEQKKKLKEDNEHYQALALENDIRIAIFSRTMKPVKQTDVEAIVNEIYQKEKNKEVTKKQLLYIIEKTAEKMFGETNVG